MIASELSELRTHVLRTMVDIRSVPRQLHVGSSNEAKNSEIWEGNLEGRPADRLIIYLRSSGCTWAMNHGKNDSFRSGCLDCEHSVADTTYGRPISAAHYLEQFVKRFDVQAQRHCPILCLYNEGSFFNEKELPAKARRDILHHIAKSGRVERLVVESLPEFISDSVLLETKELLHGVQLEVGIGLESVNSTVRSLCINKPYTLRSYEKAAVIVRRHCRLLAYVLLKPSFLTEGEAMLDTIETIKYAFSHGANAVSIEPVSIGRYTMSGVLHHLGLYRPAWLWTVLECAKAALPFGEVRIGGYQFSPSYVHYAHNCTICTKHIKRAIRDFNETHDFSYLRNATCVCRERWQEELKLPTLLLERRIQQQLQEVDKFLQNGNVSHILEST